MPHAGVKKNDVTDKVIDTSGLREVTRLRNKAVTSSVQVATQFEPPNRIRVGGCSLTMVRTEIMPAPWEGPGSIDAFLGSF
jgi:hypothetical protein